MSQWRWGNDWKGLQVADVDEYNGDKYADLALYDPSGNPVIALGLDHYQPVWDTKDASELTARVRQIIVDALNAAEALQ